MLHLKTLSFLLFFHTQLATALPVPPEYLEEKNMKTAENYLRKFYHLPSNQFRSARNATMIAEKLKEMQRFFGLPETGKPDAATIEMMEKPRCGVPDSGDFLLTPGSPKWTHTNLTYRIINHTPQLSKAEVKKEIERAFQIWSVPSTLTFTETSEGEADINIAFVSRDHGDNSPFDGPNGILAHAFQPGQGIGGDAHFDSEETWTRDSNNYNLFLVAAHEFGHSLGLSHSTDPGALMYPNYAYREPSTYSLPQDDINGIQTIYGPSDNPVQPTGPSTPTACDPRLRFDAATTLRGEIYFFKDKYFWRRHPQLRTVDLNFISLFWPFLPNGLQAAYEDFDRDLVFLFKGRQYWALSGYDLLQGYPRDISNYGFPRSVQAIDAAVSYNGKTYFFVNNQCWRYDNQRRSMDPGYPTNIASMFPGINCRVDAVFLQNYRKDKHEENSQLAQAYLNQFYSLETEGSHLVQSQNRSLLDGKLREMQAFFGLTVTGKLDSDTLEMMKVPRCGVPDVGQYGYTLPGWRKYNLTYRIMNYTPDMTQADVDEAIQKALQVWSKVTPLMFTRISKGVADIMIAFRTRVHGWCPRHFDGPLGVLGHAFPPGLGLGGDTHFDEDETWTTKDGEGFNLFLVAAHEFGHSLGLSHSSDQTALMFPNYVSLDPSKYPLSQDDINGIQSIYGSPPKIPTKPNGNPVPHACEPNLTFDAVTTFRREIMFLKGRHLWRIYSDITGAEFEFIDSFWPSLPADLQAAYESPRDEVLVFKDENFWVIKGNSVLPDYPKSIHTLGFPRRVKKIDAAVCDHDTKKTFFFVGIWFWRYDEMAQAMDRGFPQRIMKRFPGIRLRVDAVFQRNGFFYFFRGSRQFEYDIKAKIITQVMKTNSWFLCNEPLNSLSNVSVKGKAHSIGTVILHHKSVSLLIFSIVHVLTKTYN